MGQITQLQVISPLQNSLGQTLFFDAALGSGGSVDGIKSSPGTLYSVSADNSLNSSASYIRLWDLASNSVTNGATSPDWILEVLPNVSNTFYFSGGQSGTIFGTALSASASSSPGTTGTGAPANSMKVTICYS
jgi:hypothetical protein